MKIRLPVRSAIYKHDTGGLVVRWVTTSESPLLYVSELLFANFWWWGQMMGGVGQRLGYPYLCV